MSYTPEAWQKLVVAVGAEYPDVSYFTGGPGQRGWLRGGMFHSPRVRGDRLALLFSGDVPHFVPVDGFSCEAGSTAVLGNLGAVPVHDALVELRVQDPRAAETLLGIVKRLGAKASVELTIFPPEIEAVTRLRNVVAAAKCMEIGHHAACSIGKVTEAYPNAAPCDCHLGMLRAVLDAADAVTGGAS